MLTEMTLKVKDGPKQIFKKSFAQRILGRERDNLSFHQRPERDTFNLFRVANYGTRTL